MRIIAILPASIGKKVTRGGCSTLKWPRCSPLIWPTQRGAGVVVLSSDLAPLGWCGWRHAGVLRDICTGRADRCRCRVFLLVGGAGMERRVELFGAIRFDWQRNRMPSGRWRVSLSSRRVEVLATILGTV